MKTLFTALAVLWLQFNVAAQSPSSIQAQVIPDSVIFKTGKPLPQSGSEKKIFNVNSPSLRLAGRSAVVLAAGSVAGGLMYDFADEPLRHFAQEHRNENTNCISALLQPLGRSAYMTPAAGLIYASGLMFRNVKMQRTGLLLVSSLLINDFVTGKLKDEFQRSRPNEAAHNFYFDGGEGGRHHLSFPSAHTSTAFTFATTIATVYEDYKWVPPVAYSMATLVGLSRIHDNKHWGTDVMAGAAVGYLTAKATNYLLSQTEEQLHKHKIKMYVSPNVSASTIGLNLGGTL